MYSTFFVNNKTYGADDINKVFAHLTTQGVSLYKDTGNPLIDLDTAMSNLVNPGIDSYNTNSCKVVSAGNGYYKISKGCCWMPSGSCVIFDDDGYVFELNFLDSAGTKGTTCYVYLRQGGAESEGVSNDINIIVSGEAPTATDMPLATISSAGAITDKRTYSRAKIAVPTNNIILSKRIYLDYNMVSGVYQNTSKTYSISLEFPGIQYIYGMGEPAKYSEGYYSILVKLTSSFQLVRKESSSFVYARKANENTIEIYGERSSNGWNAMYINLTLF